jgi:hypothetical protein
MAALGRVVVEAIVHHYGRKELLRRLAHPFWFQSLGAVMGMDWHSSGITTSVLGALKRGLAPVEDELGLHVCGGRGAQSRKTPHELAALAERIGFDGAKLARTSRLVAKVDSAALQDGFELYLHGFVVDDDASWVVVQQGMKVDARKARRYHWCSEGLEGPFARYVDAPHAAIDGEPEGEIVNLVDRLAGAARDAQVELVKWGPEKVLAELERIEGAGEARRRPRQALLPIPHLSMPAHHDVRPGDVLEKRLGAAILAAQARGPVDFVDVLETPGVGARTIRALALVAEVVHGAPSRFSDPARFAFAHGGKDGHPFPVPLKVYDETLRVMRDAVSRAKLGQADRLASLKRLDDQARQLERVVLSVDVEGVMRAERRASHLFGGRTVAGPARPPREPVVGPGRKGD